MRDIVEENISPAQQHKRKYYKDRIRKQHNSDSLLFVLYSGGAWGRSAINILKTIADRRAGNQEERKNEIRREILMDVLMSLIKSRMISLREPRKNIHGQIEALNNTLC